MSSRKVVIAALCLFFVAMPPLATPAHAAYCPSDSTQNSPQADDIIQQINDHTDSEFRDQINDHVTEEFEDHREWMMDLWEDTFLPSMQMMTEQLTATALQQFMIIGTFFDAKHQLETQRLFQTMAAQSQKDYTPSEGLCTIGTSIRSLASSDRNAELTALHLSRHFIGRQSLNANTNASEGPKEDLEGRIEQFRRVYCERNDNNRELDGICGNAVDQLRKNKDIDYTRTLGAPDTLNINFSDDTITAEEEDLLALSSHLYSHDVFAAIPKARLAGDPDRQALYLSQRSLVAQRSVAEQSYQAIAAMKTRGEANSDSTKYLQALLEDTGIPNEDALAIIGDNPSYYAQMGIMTKTLFQRPEFYVGLYDRPANIARKSVALHGLSIMQKRDLFKSTIRSEAMISVWLELELQDAQESVLNQLNRLKD